MSERHDILARTAFEQLTDRYAMPVSMRVKTLAGYLCALLILSVGIVSLLNMRAESDAQEWSMHSRILRRTMLETVIAALNMETGQRAFELNGDERSLESFWAGRKQLDKRLPELAALTADSPEQHQRVADITLELTEKQKLLLRAVVAKRNGASSADILGEDLGKASMDEIRRKANEFLEAEGAVRLARENKALRLRSITMAVVGLGNLVAFVLAAACTAWIRGALQETHEARVLSEARATELREQAERLKEHERLLAEQLSQQKQLSWELTVVNSALGRSNRDLEQFAYVASHDLKAPLRGIANLSSWIEEDLGSAVTESAQKQFSTMRGRVQRLEGLINGIAAYSRAGRSEGAVERIDVGALLREVSDLASPPEGVSIVIDDGMPILRAEKTPLSQIFLNLVSNAMKHGTPKGGTIKIHCVEQPSSWLFGVTDDGPGIDAEYHERIFGLFQTLESRDRVEGAGIGLAVVKKLVERHGGSVRVESRLGHGATFFFDWPKDGKEVMNGPNNA